MKLLWIPLLAASMICQAQTPGAQGQNGQRNPAALKNYLALTENQVTSLVQMHRQLRTSLQDVRQEMLQKQKALRQMRLAGNAVRPRWPS